MGDSDAACNLCEREFASKALLSSKCAGMSTGQSRGGHWPRSTWWSVRERRRCARRQIWAGYFEMFRPSFTSRACTGLDGPRRPTSKKMKRSIAPTWSVSTQFRQRIQPQAGFRVLQADKLT